jgi:hypothetical protein
MKKQRMSGSPKIKGSAKWFKKKNKIGLSVIKKNKTQKQKVTTERKIGQILNEEVKNKEKLKINSKMTFGKLLKKQRENSHRGKLGQIICNSPQLAKTKKNSNIKLKENKTHSTLLTSLMEYNKTVDMAGCSTRIPNSCSYNSSQALRIKGKRISAETLTSVFISNKKFSPRDLSFQSKKSPRRGRTVSNTALVEVGVQFQKKKKKNFSTNFSFFNLSSKHPHSKRKNSSKLTYNFMKTADDFSILKKNPSENYKKFTEENLSENESFYNQEERRQQRRTEYYETSEDSDILAISNSSILTQSEKKDHKENMNKYSSFERYFEIEKKTQKIRRWPKHNLSF